MKPSTLALLVIVLLAAVSFLTPLYAQAITEGQARDWATYAAGKAAGDPKAFDELFVRLARIMAPAYRADPFSMGVTVHRSEGLDIVLIGPVSAFQAEASEAVRKMSPLETVAWSSCGVIVFVAPSRIDALDIEKIVITRGGTIVTPVANNLVSTVMITRVGTKVALHKGSVCYSPSTFAVGAEVTVTAIPAAGDNIIKTLGDTDLRMII